MAFNETILRVGVDWENKGFVSIGTKTTDALNKYPDPLYHSTLLTNLSHVNNVVTKANMPHSLRIISDQLGVFSGLCAAYLAPIILELDVEAIDEYIEIGVNSGGTKNIPVTASLPYSVKLWTITNNDFDVAFYQFRTGTGTWSVVDTESIGTGSLEVTTLNGTLNSDATHIKIRFTLKSSGDPRIICVAGILVTQTASGSEPEFFNPGTPLCIYDDVTNYLMNINGDEGKTEWDSLLPDEGNLTVNLKNQTRIFSPEYSGGALFGNHRTGLGCIVRIKRNVASLGDGWVTIWSGWITKYDVEPNQYGGRTATINARQGLFNLEKVLMPRKILDNPTDNEIFSHMLSSGYITFGAPYIARVGWSYLEGASYLFNPEHCFDHFDSSSEIIPVFGHNLDEYTEATKMLSWMTQFLLGHSFINATGQIAFVHRIAITGGTPVTYNFNDFQTYNYQYGIEQRNKITSSIREHKFLTVSGTEYVKLYKENYTLSANEFRIIPVRYTESTFRSSMVTTEFLSDTKTIQPDNIITAAFQVLTTGQFNSVKTSDNTVVSPATINVLVTGRNDEYDWERPAKGQNSWSTGVDLYIVNTNAFEVNFDLTIRTTNTDGAIYLNSEQVFSTVDDTESLNIGVREVTVNETDNPLLDLANIVNFQTRLLERYSTDTGWFNELGFVVENIGTFPFEYPGKLIELSSEYQTGIVDKGLLVIGRQFNYSPQLLKFNYTLAPMR